MAENKTDDFGSTAVALAKNPLGIIALFIVLVYAVAALVTGLGNNFTPAERVPLIYFLAIFPVMVLFIFAWLVAYHSIHLYAPTDFGNQANYVKLHTPQAVAAIHKALAVKEDTNTSDASVVQMVQNVKPRAMNVNSEILWVDDNPQNNVYERQAFEALGYHFTLASHTNQALELLKSNKYVAIISDMGRSEGSREGYVLLEQVRKMDTTVPYFIYAGSNSVENQKMTLSNGGQGTTNNPAELFQMVMKAIN